MNKLIQTVGTLKLKIQELESNAYKLKDLYLGLLERQKMLQGIVDQVPLGIIVTRALTVVFANRKFAEIFGFNDPTEITSMESVETLFSPQARVFIASHFQAAVQGQQSSFPFEFEGQRRDGTLIWLEGTSVPGHWGSEPVTVSTVYPLEQLRLLCN